MCSYISCIENNIDSTLAHNFNLCHLLLIGEILRSGVTAHCLLAETTAGGMTDEAAHGGKINRLSNLIAAADIETLTE